jgi:hypothetical protein
MDDIPLDTSRLNMSKLLRALACTSALLIAGQTCSQAGPVRSTQVHGAAIVDIIQDAGDLKISFVLSGLDAVGFEHAPQSSADEDKVNAALDVLQTPDNWIVPNASALCHRTFIGVTPNVFRSMHEGEAHADAKQRRSDPQAGGKHRSDPVHADIGVNYAFACDAPLRLRSLTFNLIERFPRVRAIIVNLSLPSGPSQAVVTTPQAQVTFSTAADD